MEVKIIRGYKLKLWKERLNLAPAFIEQIDVTGMNYIHTEYIDHGNVTIVILTKIRGSKSPIPVVMTLKKEEFESLVERIEI